MTGPEHYRAAEALLREVDARQNEIPEQRQAIAAQAQVHATLAAAAATLHAAWVNNDHLANSEHGDYNQWGRVTA